MERAARRFVLPLLAATAVAHGTHLFRYFVRDETVALHKVAGWTFLDILGRSRLFFSGSLGERPHVLGYAFVKLLWALFGPWFPGYAATMIAVHLSLTTLVLVLGVRLAPETPRVGALAAFAFGVGGASADIGDFAIVQHVSLGVCAVLLALSYLGYRRRPTLRRAALVLFWAFVATLTQESGPVATLTPVVLEASLAIGPAALRPPRGASIRALLGVCGLSIALSLPRLAHEATALLVRSEALDAAAAERYTITFSPVHVLDNVAHLVTRIAFVPPAFALPFVLFLLSGALSPGLRAVTVFGMAEGLLLALPYATIEYTAPFYAYSASPFLGLALGAAVAALAERGPPSREGAFSRWAGMCALVSLWVLAAARIRARDAADAHAFATLRSIRAGLRAALPAGPAPVSLELHGLPTGRIHPDYPFMLADFLPVFVPGRSFSAVWVRDPRLDEPLEIDFVTYSAKRPVALDVNSRRFEIVEDRLVSCTVGRCTGD